MKLLWENADGVRLLHVGRHDDHRGWFTEAFNEAEFRSLTGVSIGWVQDSRFFSRKGALRGPHFLPLRLNQFKLVECIQGRVLDVAICVDRASPRFGTAFWEKLVEGDGLRFLVPPGYAHAVLALEDSLVSYKTNVCNLPGLQKALDWRDARIGVPWPITPSLLNENEKTYKLAEVDCRE